MSARHRTCHSLADLEVSAGIKVDKTALIFYDAWLQPPLDSSVEACTVSIVVGGQVYR